MSTFAQKQSQLSEMLAEVERLSSQVEQKPKMTKTEEMVSIFEDIGAGGMKGVATVAGMPADIANMILSLGPKFSMSNKMYTRSKESKDIKPLRIPAGTKEVQDLMGIAGISTKPEGKTDVGRYIGRAVEEGTTAALPMLGLMRGGNALLSATKSKTFFGGLRQQMAKSPGTIISAEAGLGGLAGIGAETGKDVAPNSPLAELSGAVIATVVPSSAVNITKNAMALRPAIRDENKVRDIVQSAVTNTSDAISGLVEKTSLKIPSAKKSGDTGLLDLEASILQHDEAFRGDFEGALESVRKSAKAKFSSILRGTETTEQMFNFVKERVSRLDGLISRRIEQTMESAQRKIDEIDVPYASAEAEREAASQIARDSLEVAYKNARNQESVEWNKIDFTAKGETAQIRQTAEKVRNDLGRLGTKDPELEKLLNDLYGRGEAKTRSLDTAGMTGPEKLKARREAKELNAAESQTLMLDIEDVSELRKLRTRILDAKRKENGTTAPSRTVLGKLDEINASVLNTMESIVAKAETTDPLNGSQLRIAMSYTKKMHDKFTRGSVGKLMRYDSVGGERVPDIDTLRTLIRPGEIGAAKADDVIRSVDELINAVPAEELKGAVQTYLKSQFVLSVTNGQGIVNAVAMERFIKANGPVLNRFPELKNQLQNTKAAQELADQSKNSGEKRIASIYDKNKSRAALYLDIGSEKPELVIASILKRSNTTQGADMKGLIALAKKDKTGRALSGLKTATSDHMWSKVIHDSAIEGKSFIESEKLISFVKDNERGLTELYGKKGVASLRKMASEIAKTERVGNATGVADVNRIKTMFISAIGRIAGTTMLPKIGVSGLVGAGIGRQAALEIMKKPADADVRALLLKALNDPEVMKTMLMSPENPKVVDRLRAHFLSLGVTQEELGEE